jgi:hypothetical protein
MSKQMASLRAIVIGKGLGVEGRQIPAEFGAGLVVDYQSEIISV